MYASAVFGDSLYGELGILALLQEGFHLFMGLETVIEFCLYLCGCAILADQGEYGVDTIVWFALELLDFTLTLHDEAYGNTLYTTGREGWFHLSPQYRRELEAHDAVEHTTCLLGIHQVHVQMAWVLNSV